MAHLHGNISRSPAQEYVAIADWVTGLECGEWEYCNDFDVYGKGTFINEFENHLAKLFGFEAAVFLPSGVMAQNIALRMYSDESGKNSFAMHPSSHLELHEFAAYDKLHGLKATLVGNYDEPFTTEDLANAGISADAHATVVVELPMREVGGKLMSWDDLNDLKAWCKQRGIKLHMDGARLWETKEYYRKEYSDICKGFDSVYVSFYKGINNLAGAALMGTRPFIDNARVWQKRHGGGLITLHPYVASAAMRLEPMIAKMPSFFNKALKIHDAARAAIQAQQAHSNIILSPSDRPQVNMIHFRFNVAEETYNRAHEMAKTKTGISLRAPAKPFPSALLSQSPYIDRGPWCFVELYVGENALNVKDEDIRQLFDVLFASLKQ